MSFCVLSNHCWLTKEVAIVFMSSREADVLRVVGFHIRWWHLWCINIEDRHHTHARRGHLRPAGGRPDRANKARFFRYFVCQRVVVGETPTEIDDERTTLLSILYIGSLSSAFFVEKVKGIQPSCHWKVCQGWEILSSGVNSLEAIVLVQASIQAKDLSLFTSLRALPSPSLVLTANLMPMRRVKKVARARRPQPE